jgi:hypothetical protein
MLTDNTLYVSPDKICAMDFYTGFSDTRQVICSHVKAETAQIFRNSENIIKINIYYCLLHLVYFSEKYAEQELQNNSRV